MERVTGPGLDGTYGAVYARLVENSANTSDLVEYTYFKSSSDATLATIHRKYDNNRDLVDFVENLAGSTTVSKYDYTNDTLGRRTAVALTGSAFTGGSGDHHWDFGYNGRSELTGGERRTGANPGQGTLFAMKGDFDYVYDPIGNRTESNVDGASPAMTYTTNAVNQYTATSDPESFTHDKDGNLDTDGLFKYAWDAENRLTAVQTKRAGDPVDGDTLVEFKYDYMGRRVEKTYSSRSGTSWIVQPGYPQRFVYDEWNVVLVLNDSGDSTRKYTWGLDLSGTIHGAGGIGGLLACEEPQAVGDPKRYWFMYDANGNVGQVLDATDTGNISIAARYEYDPYGNPIPIPQPPGPGPYADLNPIRFSTKWFDFETGLGYWGYRYYSPRLGRWISRDPIGEKGGLSLYAFVLNRPACRVDPLGESCKVYFKCSLAKSTPRGKCDMDCDYSCTETKRENVGGGMVTCDELPSPVTYTLSTGGEGGILCHLTEGLCGARESCASTKQHSQLYLHIDDPSRDCSRAACRNGCDSAYDTADVACDKLKGPLKSACKAAAKAARTTCYEGCNAWCKQP